MSSSHLPVKPGRSRKSPVMFPAGLARLRANPLWTGSVSRSYATIGIVRVAWLEALRAAGPIAKRTSTFREMRSSTRPGSLSGRPLALRSSRMIVCPSTYPSSRRPCRAPSKLRALGGPELRTPTTGIFPAGCAATPCGDVRTAKLTTPMNIRRSTPCIQRRGPLVANESRRCAVRQPSTRESRNDPQPTRLLPRWWLAGEPAGISRLLAEHGAARDQRSKCEDPRPLHADRSA